MYPEAAPSRKIVPLNVGLDLGQQNTRDTGPPGSMVQCKQALCPDDKQLTIIRSVSNLTGFLQSQTTIQIISFLNDIIFSGLTQNVLVDLFEFMLHKLQPPPFPPPHPTMNTTTLQQIEAQAEKLAATAKALAREHKEAGLGESSPEWGSASSVVPHEVDRLRSKMLASVNRLQAMLAAPSDFIQHISHQVYDSYFSYFPPLVCFDLHQRLHAQVTSCCPKKKLTNKIYCLIDPDPGVPPMAERVPGIGLHPPERGSHRDQ